MKLSAVLLGSCLASYSTYTIPQENAILEWHDTDNMMDFLEKESHKEYVQYQAPDDQYVPIAELPIVFLNGIKFRRQGKLPRPGTLERFQKLTRTNEGKLVCHDAELVREEKQKRNRNLMEMDVPKDSIAPRRAGLDLAGAMFQANYPRYNGRAAPLPYNELEQIDDLSNLVPENEEEEQIQNNPTLDLTDIDPLHEGMESEVGFAEPAEDDVTIMNLASVGLINMEGVDMEPQTEEESQLDREELRLIRLKKQFYQQEKIKIGCCNGQPYNSKKRCCCRRVSFDKDKKFCCAINGCESFQIFDRSNKQHYADCLSLSGLVIQEYGYHGQSGQPKMEYSGGQPRRIPAP